MKIKFLLSLIVFASSALDTSAQFLSTLFNQKEADLKSEAKQLALLGTYVHWVEQGYGIAEQGLRTVETIKNGDLGLHTRFFSSLKAVRPDLVNKNVINDIQSDAARIDALTESILAEGEVNADIQRFFQRSAQDCQQEAHAQLDLLFSVLGSRSWTMSEDERLGIVNGVQRKIKTLRSSLQALSQRQQLMKRAQRKDNGDIDLLQKLK